MSYRTNRKTRGVFKLGSKDPTSPAPGNIIRDAPDIVSFESGGSVYVEDGSGERYIVRYQDGHTAEVEISDAYDYDGSDEDHQMYSMRVVWDGAVDYEDSYDSASEESMDEIKAAMIKRYGKIAEDFLGVSEQQINEKITGTQTPRSQVNQGILDSDSEDGGILDSGSQDSGIFGEESNSVGLMSPSKKKRSKKAAKSKEGILGGDSGIFDSDESLLG